MHIPTKGQMGLMKHCSTQRSDFEEVVDLLAPRADC